MADLNISAYDKEIITKYITCTGQDISIQIIF